MKKVLVIEDDKEILENTPLKVGPVFFAFARIFFQDCAFGTDKARPRAG